jgi:hypothetical protein
VTIAEMTARELGGITLDESLALTVLVVQKDPGRRSRYTVRWLLRLLEEDENLTIRGGDAGGLGSGRARRPWARGGAVDPFGPGRKGD